MEYASAPMDEAALQIRTGPGRRRRSGSTTRSKVAKTVGSRKNEVVLMPR